MLLPANVATVVFAAARATRPGKRDYSLIERVSIAVGEAEAVLDRGLSTREFHAVKAMVESEVRKEKEAGAQRALAALDERVTAHLNEVEAVVRRPLNEEEREHVRKCFLASNLGDA